MIRKFLIALTIPILAISSGCSDDKIANSVVGDGDATYVVTLDATWSPMTHPENFPGNPHFSRLVGATHNLSVSLWSDGELASAGIKNMAETGAPDILTSEVTAAIDAVTAEFSLLGDGIGTSPGSAMLTFAVTTDYPLVTVVSMLAPSPDWFVGVSGLSLRSDGDWVQELTVEAFLYDAGTDSGPTYTSANQATDPFVPVSRIDMYPALVDGEIRSIGTFTFTRQ